MAALLDDEATVKTFRKDHGHVWLIPHNPAYSPIDGTHAEIMGKVVTVLRKSDVRLFNAIEIAPTKMKP